MYSGAYWWVLVRYSLYRQVSVLVCALHTSFLFYYFLDELYTSFLFYYFIIGFHSRSGCLLAWREKGSACLDGKVASNSSQDGTVNDLKEHLSFFLII